MDLPSSDFTNKTSTVIKGDNPIRNSQEDVLGRVDVAKSFARHILALDASEGAVVGVLGPWGSGKTSFINLARTEFKQEGIHVLDFNPWMFSGAEHLVERFFIELTTKLSTRQGLDDLCEALKYYSEMLSGIGWLPLTGPWTERVSTMMMLLAKFVQGGKGGIDERRDKITTVLKRIEKPIIVILDDVDRLSVSEIRDIFKLVRLTANFPKIVYIVVCDRFRVIFSRNRFAFRSMASSLTLKILIRWINRSGLIFSWRSFAPSSGICGTFAAILPLSEEP